MLFNGSVYKDDRGHVLGVVIVARDVTDQKRIATELNDAKIQAEKATLIAEEATAAAEDAAPDTSSDNKKNAAASHSMPDVAQSASDADRSSSGVAA